jgi:hypothetical protein
MKKGDLAWLPSATSLLQFSRENDPESGVLGEIADTYYKIEYRGGKWAVPKHYLYELQEAAKHAS